MNGGWVKLHRQLLDHPRLSTPGWIAVWVYCLLHAAHEPTKKVFNGEIVTLNPGQFIATYAEIAINTGVSKSSVFRLLTILESETQIGTLAGSKSSMFTVLNWDLYQHVGTINGTLLERHRNAAGTLRERCGGVGGVCLSVLSGSPVLPLKEGKEVQEGAALVFPAKLSSEAFREKFSEWMIYRRKLKKAGDWSKLFQRQLKGIEKRFAFESNAIDAIDTSMESGWMGIFPRNQTTNRNSRPDNSQKPDHSVNVPGRPF